MYNGVPSFDNYSRLKDAYDAIHEQNSSYRQSLLVSPHCSKFQRISHADYNQDNDSYGVDNGLMQYIRPFENEQLNKTEMKPKLRKRVEVDHRKKTEPEEDINSYKSRQHNLQLCISELQMAIKEKDERILTLERNLAKLSSKSIILPTQNTVVGSPQAQKQLNSIYISRQIDQSPPKTFKNRNKKHKQTEQQKQNYFYLEAQIQNYKKQIRFLTHNNQQLYEQVHKISEYCEKLRKTLSSTILYTKQLEDKLNEMSKRNECLQEMNHTLIEEKGEMMKNYEQELKLFKKMKKVWQSNYGKCQQAKQNAAIKAKSKEKTAVPITRTEQKRSKSYKIVKAQSHV